MALVDFFRQGCIASAPTKEIPKSGADAIRPRPRDTTEGLKKEFWFGTVVVGGENAIQRQLWTAHF